MIAKQYKKGTKTGVKQGAKTGFKRHKKRNLAIFDNLEQRGTAILCRSTSFQPFFVVPPLFFTLFDDFRQKGEKGRQKMEAGKGKKSVLSNFFPVPVFSFSFPGTSVIPCAALALDLDFILSFLGRTL